MLPFGSSAEVYNIDVLFSFLSRQPQYYQPFPFQSFISLPVPLPPILDLRGRVTVRGSGVKVAGSGHPQVRESDASPLGILCPSQMLLLGSLARWFGSILMVISCCVD